MQEKWKNKSFALSTLDLELILTEHAFNLIKTVI